MLNSICDTLIGAITLGSKTFTIYEFIMYVALIAVALILIGIIIAILVRHAKSNSDVVESGVEPEVVEEPQPVVAAETVEQPIEEEQPVEEEPVFEEVEETIEPITESEPIEEEQTVEEPIVEDEPKVVQKPQPVVVREVAPDVVRRGKILIRYDKSFTARLIQSDDELRDYYDELKGELLSYDGVKSRISWKHESFRKGRTLVAKLKIRGKHVTIYLPLNPTDYIDTKYKIDDVSHVKANADTPCAYAIINDRRCTYAKDLIAVVMNAQQLEKQETEPVKYTDDYPYDTTDNLIHRELIKLIYSRIGENGEEPLKEVSAEELDALMAEEDAQPIEDESIVEEPAEEPIEEPIEEPVEEVVEEQPEEVEEEPADEVVEEVEEQNEVVEEEQVEEPVEDEQPVEDQSEDEDEPVEESVEDEPVEEPTHAVTVEEAKGGMTDEEAQQSVEQSNRYADKTKTGIINVDTLSQKFNAGEKVTLDEIKKRVPGFNKKTTYIKVLARGAIDKPLTVEADEYSIDAVKMIVLAGGTVIRTSKK